MTIDEKAKEKAIIQADDIQRDEGGRWVDIFVERYEALKNAKTNQPVVPLPASAVEYLKGMFCDIAFPMSFHKPQASIQELRLKSEIKIYL